MLANPETSKIVTMPSSVDRGRHKLLSNAPEAAVAVQFVETILVAEAAAEVVAEAAAEVVVEAARVVEGDETEAVVAGAVEEAVDAGEEEAGENANASVKEIEGVRNGSRSPKVGARTSDVD